MKVRQKQGDERRCIKCYTMVKSCCLPTPTLSLSITPNEIPAFEQSKFSALSKPWFLRLCCVTLCNLALSSLICNSRHTQFSASHESANRLVRCIRNANILNHFLRPQIDAFDLASPTFWRLVSSEDDGFYMQTMEHWALTDHNFSQGLILLGSLYAYTAPMHSIVDYHIFRTSA